VLQPCSAASAAMVASLAAVGKPAR
jgi:hypothetical protein